MIIKRGMKGNLVTAWQSFLFANALGEIMGNVDGNFGFNTEKATIQYQINNGLVADGAAGTATIEKAKEQGFELPVIEEENGITIEQLSYVMEETKMQLLEFHLPYCNNAMQKFEINNSLRMQHFLAQVGHESIGLKYMSEIASGEAYEDRGDLGNIYPGDGKKFKGHGPLEITGRANHTEFFNYIGRPELIETPEILETDLELCWCASGWFWKSRGLNEIADMDDGSISPLRGHNNALCKITRIVNGWFNGLSNRAKYLEKAKAVIV
jgi:predicted chitinase